MVQANSRVPLPVENHRYLGGNLLARLSHVVLVTLPRFLGKGMETSSLILSLK